MADMTKDDWNDFRLELRGLTSAIHQERTEAKAPGKSPGGPKAQGGHGFTATMMEPGGGDIFEKLIRYLITPAAPPTPPALPPDKTPEPIVLEPVEISHPLPLPVTIQGPAAPLMLQPAAPAPATPQPLPGTPPPLPSPPLQGTTTTPTPTPTPGGTPNIAAPATPTPATPAAPPPSPGQRPATPPPLPAPIPGPATPRATAFDFSFNVPTSTPPAPSIAPQPIAAAMAPQTSPPPTGPGPAGIAKQPSDAALPIRGAPEAGGDFDDIGGEGPLTDAAKMFADAVKEFKEALKDKGTKGDGEPGPQPSGGFVPGGPKPIGAGSMPPPQESRSVPPRSGPGSWMQAVNRSLMRG